MAKSSDRRGTERWFDVALLAALVVLAGLFGMWLQGRLAGGPGVDVGLVTLDPVRVVNAQRKLLGTKMAQGDEADAVLLARRAGKALDEAIAAEAGGRVVIVRQAVVRGPVEDITDAVLEELNKTYRAQPKTKMLRVLSF